MNAELRSVEGEGAGGFCGTGVGWGTLTGVDGSEKSKRSFEALVVAGFDGAGAGEEAKLKSPKSFEESGSGFA